MLTHFFDAIKDRVGVLTPKWFMSDLAEQFYNAWTSTFYTCTPPKRLLCTWHVDKAWRKNIDKLADDQLKITIYHNLRVLLDETDVPKFEVLLQRTLQSLRDSPLTCDFADYFECYYVKKKEQWAMCYRKEAAINTNMYVEAFHRVLKYVYLKGKVNKRLDNCIGVLLKLARDKGFERITKIEKGKMSDRITQIRVRHKTSLKMPVNLITETKQYHTWEVNSMDGKNTYIVGQVNEVCPYNCAMMCSDCHICLHMYSCDYPDALIRASICKHVHLLVRSLASTSSTPQASKRDDTMDKAVVLQNIRNPDEIDNLTTCRKKIHDKILVLEKAIDNVADANTLQEINKLLTSALSHVKITQQSSDIGKLPASNQQPPNKHIGVQRPFHSTKRKRNCTNIRLSKPNSTEKTDILNILLSTTNTQCPPLQHKIYRKWYQ